MALNCADATLSEQKNDRNHGYFNGIKGVSSQALDDFKSLKIEHCAILYPVVDFVSKFKNILICFQTRVNISGLPY